MKGFPPGGVSNTAAALQCAEKLMPDEGVIRAGRIGTPIPNVRFDFVDTVEDSGSGCSQLCGVFQSEKG